MPVTGEAEQIAAGTVASVIILHTIGLSGPELELRSPEARTALAWLSLQDPDMVKGFCDLIAAARDVEARRCVGTGS